MIFKMQCPGTDILMVASSACENSICHIWSQYDRLLLRYHEKRVLTTIDGTITWTNFIAYYAYGRQVFTPVFIFFFHTVNGCCH